MTTTNSLTAHLTDTEIDAQLAERVEVSCRCKTCKTNAEHLGLPLPLRAEVPALRLAIHKGKPHGLVYLAHDPSSIAAAARDRAQIIPVI